MVSITARSGVRIDTRSGIRIDEITTSRIDYKPVLYGARATSSIPYVIGMTGRGIGGRSTGGPIGRVIS